MADISSELPNIGDALQRAWRADHARRRTRRAVRRRQTLVVGLTALLTAAGAAVGATILTKNAADEERGLLDGYALFKGTQPSCEQLPDDSFVCHLNRLPTEISAYSPDGKLLTDWYLGIKAETVNKEKRVDGGCVSTRVDGLEWRCYLGEAAVAHGIVSRSYLGTYLPVPPTL